MNPLNPSNAVVPFQFKNFNLFRNAVVQVIEHKTVKDGGKTPVSTVEVIVNDQFRHVFSEKSRVSKALEHMSAADLQARLSGGSFFFINGDLIDFRDNQYNGFIHDNDSVSKMIELIGCRPVNGRDRKALGLKTMSGQVALSGYYNKSPILVPEYLAGGVFESALMYNWNPYHQNIRGVFELTRQICTNGMVGVSDFMNTQIPVINRWEEHLEIASRQIQNRVADRVGQRLKQMGTEHATVSELSLLANHCVQRLAEHGEQEVTKMDPAERSRLNNIYKIVNPVFHLADKYKAGAFTDSNISAQLPGHLSTFDAFNIATEMYSHTKENENSSGFALQKFANGLLFDQKAKREQRITRALMLPIASSFSDPTIAFFGKVSK